MPNYPARYYHKAHSSATTYSYEGEDICMDELLDDKEKVYYEGHPSGEETTPNVLILNDWSTGSWTHYKQFKLKEVLRDLIKHQFQIYYHKLGQWIPFSLKTLDLQLEDYRIHVAASDNDALRKAAVAPLNTPLKNLLCLDYFELNFLIDPDYDPSTRVAFSSDIGNKKWVGYPQRKADLTEKWQLTVVDDDFDIEIDFIPDTPIRHLILGGFHSFRQERAPLLQLNFEPDSRNIVAYGSDSVRKTPVFSSVKTIKLFRGDATETSMVHQIFGSEPNQIECLNIEALEGDLQQLADFDWSKLKMLSYETGYESRGRHDKGNTDYILSNIIAQATNLAHMTLRLNNHQKAPHIRFQFASTVLESFKLDGKYFSLQEIFSTLDQNPKLEKLAVAPYLTQESVALLESAKPHSLKVLRLEDANTQNVMTGNAFQLLLERLPELRELTFATPRLVSNDFDLARNALPNLKYIGFRLSNPGICYNLEKCLPRILAAAPNLEEFEMWPGTELHQMPLKKLKKVSWFGMVSPNRLKSLMACASNLESLTFIYHFQDQGYRKSLWTQTDFAEFPSLKEIDLCSWGDRSLDAKGDSWSGVNTAECIIRQAPNLEMVRIKDPETAPQWLHTLCHERNIKLEPTAYHQKGSEVVQEPKPAAQEEHGQSASIEAVEAAVHRQLDTTWMNRYFKHTIEKSPRTLSEYLGSLTHGEGRNQLVYLNNRQLLNALMLHLEQYCAQSDQPIFIANEPRDLACSSRYMRRTGNIGTVETGRGGRMTSFVEGISLSSSSSLPPIIVINNDNFESADNARFNATFDPVHIRKVDKLKLPESVIVIVLMNLGNPKTYKKSDLLSRFAPKYRKHCPLTDSQILEGLPQLTEASHTLDHSSTQSIEFYGQDNWKARLEGYWIMGDQWYWQDGVLSEALDRSTSLVLNNLSADDPNFQWYWAQKLLNYTRLTRREISTYHQSGYAWDSLTQVIEDTATSALGPYLLNAKYLAKFFKHYEPKDPRMIYADGLIETHPGQTLCVYQTGQISTGNKARLFAECRKNNVKLQLLEGPFPIQSSQVTLIQSTDVDHTLDKQFRTSEFLVIDISEVEASQLLGKTAPTFDVDQKKYTFKTSESFLLRELNAGKKIVLKGQFTPALIDSLAPFFVFNSGFSGELTLVSAPNEKFAVFDGCTQIDVLKADKKASLKTQYPDAIELADRLVEACPDDEPYIRLKHRMSYILRHRAEAETHSNLYAFSENNWEGLEKLTEDISDVAEDGDVMGQRQQEIEAIWDQESIVVVLGKTGGGKTEFVKRIYPDAHYGLDAIPQWLEEAKHKRSLWVGDEANISPSNWSMFEDLPYSIFYKDQYYPLTPEQAKNIKAMFIGNPYSYGGERKIATLFLRCGNTCIFDPLPAHFIGEEILEPLFAGIDLAPAPILTPILSAYTFMARLPSHMVLVTPRELCTMTLLTISTCLAYPEVAPQDIAYFFVYHMTKAIVYEQHARAFTNAFPEKPIWQPKVEHTIASDDFFLTDSRKIVLQLLEAFMRLRHFKQDPRRTKEQKVSGLGIFLIEGEPAQGKSVLLDSVLVEEDPIYVPSGGEPEEKKKQYLFGFRRGRAMRSDEINASAMFEKEMNTLLSGYDFETNELAEVPGFMVFASQNPITMDGRRAMSNAEARRTFTWKLENYTPPELCDIAVHHGMSPMYAKPFVNKFLRVVHEQIVNDETPWTVRELVALVKEARKDAALMIQKTWRKFMHWDTINHLKRAQHQELVERQQQELLERQRRELDQQHMALLEKQNQQCSSAPNNRSRYVQNPSPVVTQSSWLILFLPELIGGLLFLAGVALLMNAMIPMTAAAGLMAVGVGLFAISRIRACQTGAEEPNGSMGVPTAAA